jgi:hypothetical protein
MLEDEFVDVLPSPESQDTPHRTSEAVAINDEQL